MFNFDEIAAELDKAEEYLSFAPTPKAGTLRESPSSNNIFFYDQEYGDAHKDTQFSESLADTIRFQAPVDPAIRSVDYSSSEPYYCHNPIPALEREDPETHSDDFDEDSLPRREVPVANPPPRIGRSQQQPSAAPQPTKPKAKPISLERIQELHEARLKRQQHLLKEKRALDDLALAECTFKPQICKGSKSILTQKAQFEQLDQECRTVAGRNEEPAQSTSGDASVSERLYKEAAIRSAQHRWVQQEVEKARQLQYTFRPMLNPRYAGNAGAAEDRRPIHERIADMQKERRQYLQALKAAVEEEQTDLTFQPKIDPRSRVIAEQKLMGYGGNPNLVVQRGSRSRSPSATRPATAPAGTAQAGTSSATAAAGGSKTALSGEAEAALVLGFHTDVGARLMDQGKQAVRRRQQLQHERENELATAMAPAALCPGSERIVRRSAEYQGNFEERQVRYRSRERERRQAVLDEQERETGNWFQPRIDDKSLHIVQERRPEILLENAAQRAERLAVADAQEKEERRQRRMAEVYGAYTFTPQIDPESRVIGHSSSIEELVQNRKALQAKERIRQRVEEEFAQECTFRPKINELSRQLADPSAEDAFLANYAREFAHVGYAESGCPLDASIEASVRTNLHRARSGRINMQEPEKMARDIRAHLLDKEEKRRSEHMAKEIEELRECTFQPSLEQSQVSLERQRRDASPVVIRGLGRYLELKHMSAKQREDAAEREKEVFSVRNVDKFRRPEDGSTVVQEFRFHLTESRQHSRLDLSQPEEEVCPGSLNASAVLSHRSHRRATSLAAAVAWVV